MAQLKAQAANLVRLLKQRIDALAATKQSDWIKTDEAAQAAGISAQDMKKVLRRPRVKSLLEGEGIGCSFRGDFLYVYKDTNFGVVGDEDGGATPAATAVTAVTAAPVDYSLDPNYYWMPPTSGDIEKAIDAGLNVFLVGPAGTGKSSWLVKICEKRGTKYLAINLNGEVSVDDLVGVKDLVNGQTVFTEGVLPRALREGIPLIIDELDAAPPDVLFVLQNVLEGRPLCLTKKGAEYVMPEPGFCILATANTIGKGDDSGLYAGTNILNEAFLDRFGMVMECWYLPADEETRVLVKRTGLHKRAAEKMVKLAGLVRESMRADKFEGTFSTRKLLSWCVLIGHGVDMTDAFRYTCLAKVGPEDKKALAELAQRVYGNALEIDLDKLQ